MDFWRCREVEVQKLASRPQLAVVSSLLRFKSRGQSQQKTCSAHGGPIDGSFEVPVGGAERADGTLLTCGLDSPQPEAL